MLNNMVPNGSGGTQLRSTGAWPDDVGIIAIEIYFPNQFVDQTELEKHDGASVGKYTIGLGQSRMGFCTDREDVVSLSMTVVDRLMRRNSVPYSAVGRVDVGSETLIDKSKSVKTMLMQLFEESGNSDVEGVDSVNACYGGTAALFNCVNWVESSAWDGRYGIAVCSDIAVYAEGPARPTGGAGAVAMLIGPNAPLVIERGLRSTHIEHSYDFYKPNMSSEYPVVFGQLSVECFLRSVDRCYQSFVKKAAKITKTNVNIQTVDAIVSHAPYCKMVQKAVARIALNDFLLSSKGNRYGGVLDAFHDTKLETSYSDREVEKASMAASKEIYETKVKPSLLVANQVGNMYTASVYGGLAAYVSQQSAADLVGKRILVFSYGSGSASSMYSILVNGNRGLDALVESLSDLRARLDARACVSPADYSAVLKQREIAYKAVEYFPVGPIDALQADTWYLASRDENYRRQYAYKSADDVSVLNGHGNSGGLLSPTSTTHSNGEI